MPPKAKSWAKLSVDDQLAAVRELVTDGCAASTIAYRLAAPPKEVAKLATQARRESEQAIAEAHDQSAEAEDATFEQDPWQTYSGDLDWKFMDSCQRDLLLAAGIEAGLSAQKLAARFQNTTRSAVIGRAHRLGLQFKGGTFPRAKRAQPSKAPTPKPTTQMPVKAGGRKMRLVGGVTQVVVGSGPKPASQYDFKGRAEQRAASVGLKAHLISGEAKRPLDDITMPTSRRLQLIELTECTCKWPHGDPQSPDFNFCGHDASFEEPYCAYHTRLAYSPKSERQIAAIRSAERIR